MPNWGQEFSSAFNPWMSAMQQRRQQEETLKRQAEMQRMIADRQAQQAELSARLQGEREQQARTYGSLEKPLLEGRQPMPGQAGFEPFMGAVQKTPGMEWAYQPGKPEERRVEGDKLIVDSRTQPKWADIAPPQQRFQSDRKVLGLSPRGQETVSTIPETPPVPYSEEWAKRQQLQNLSQQYGPENAYPNAEEQNRQQPMWQAYLGMPQEQQAQVRELQRSGSSTINMPGASGRANILENAQSEANAFAQQPGAYRTKSGQKVEDAFKAGNLADIEPDPIAWGQFFKKQAMLFGNTGMFPDIRERQEILTSMQGQAVAGVLGGHVSPQKFVPSTNIPIPFTGRGEATPRSFGGEMPQAPTSPSSPSSSGLQRGITPEQKAMARRRFRPELSQLVKGGMSEEEAIAALMQAIPEAFE